MEEDEQTAVSEEDRETGNVEVTDTLQGILDQNISVTQSTSKAEEFEDIEVILKTDTEELTEKSVSYCLHAA